MMRYLVLMGSLFFIAGCNLFSPETPDSLIFTLNIPFEVQEGETATTASETPPEVVVTFVRKIIDSRCPIRMACDVPGEGIIEVEAQGTTFELQINEGEIPPQAVEVEGFAYTLVQLSPYPDGMGNHLLPATATLHIVALQ